MASLCRPSLTHNVKLEMSTLHWRRQWCYCGGGYFIRVFCMCMCVRSSNSLHTNSVAATLRSCAHSQFVCPNKISQSNFIHCKFLRNQDREYKYYSVRHAPIDDYLDWLFFFFIFWVIDQISIIFGRFFSDFPIHPIKIQYYDFA